ncbi:MAG: DUF3891 family protein [Alphaproteobacteria bacterium]|nr:DUF3891 family protein [Alphaproteobacteria bacterium]
MIVQTAPAGEPQIVITMTEHMALAGRFARAFGNAAFEPIEPREEVLYIVDHHDAGWADVDAKAAIDSETGLPYHLQNTPFETIVETSRASPEFNSRRHAYCGLLSSMHSWGLYNGRYGLSDHVLLDTLAAENRSTADEMLEGELSRQERLKAELASNPETAAWIEQGHLFQNYKQLQFFDTLALYFNCAHEGARVEQTFEHIPRNPREDVTVTVRPTGEGVYHVSPYPFADDPLDVSFTGRSMVPDPDRKTADLGSIATDRQTIMLTAG